MTESRTAKVFLIGLLQNVTNQCTSYLCTRCSHWIHSRCSGLRNVADYHRSPPPSPDHTPSMSDKTFNLLQWNANGIGNKRTELSIFLKAHNVKVVAHSGVQAHDKFAKSQHPELHPGTTGSTPRPRRRLIVFYP